MVGGLNDIIVATHYWAPGWATALDEYLKPRVTRYRAINHPLFADGSPSTYRFYTNGERSSAFDAPGGHGPSRYVMDVRRTVQWSQKDGPTELFIAGDNLLALAGLWLRRRGLAKAVALYSIDFVPNRFGNALLNRAYHGIDRLAVARSDVVWNGSSGIAEGRRQRDGARKAAPQILVPMGAHTKRIGEHAHRDRSRTLVYLGHLLEKQGLQVVLRALPAIRARVPDVGLLVIGDGPYRQEAERLAAELDVTSAVEFAGFMDDHVAIERRLLECAIGVAPYVPSPENYSQYTDLPGKIVTYLACGLAVITTEVPRRGRLLEEMGAGRVVPYAPESFATAIVEYLRDPAALKAARESALEIALSYDWDEIFELALTETVRLTPALDSSARP